MKPSNRRLLVLALAVFAFVPTSAFAEGWKAGAAKVIITPEKLMWMSGYGGRNKPAEGKLIDLWAKAVVLEDAEGRRAALVTLDLVGIDREVGLRIRHSLKDKYGLKLEQTALATSHTHCGPVVGGNLIAMYTLDEAQKQLIADYAVTLEQKVTAAVGQAIERLAPASIAWGNGQATFAVNRRNNKEAEVPKLREQGRLVGPVDYDVPVLSVRDGEGKLTAVVFGYACHATVMGFYQWSGDYPGFAQLALEEAHPDAVALFWAGCGADQNPLPRREVELSKEYGKRLAEAVDRTLNGVMRPIEGDLDTSYAEVALPFEKLPTQAELEQTAASKDKFEAGRAQLLLGQIAAGKPLQPTYPYPVQLWRLGGDVLFITLGGEVVVDYAVRLKAELGRERTWVAGYTNDVMAYIPSRRVLIEGGYEGGGSMVYYGQPSIWAPPVEELVIKQVHELVKAAGAER